MDRLLRIAVTSVIDVPNEAVWSVLGNFGEEHRWTHSVTHCTRDTADVRVGTVRSCRLPRPLMGRTGVRETLIEFEHGCALAYCLEGAAGPFAFASSRWLTTSTIDHSTKVTVEGSFEPKNAAIKYFVWPVVKLMLRPTIKSVLRELAAFLISQRKMG